MRVVTIPTLFGSLTLTQKQAEALLWTVNRRAETIHIERCELEGSVFQGSPTDWRGFDPVTGLTVVMWKNGINYSNHYEWWYGNRQVAVRSVDGNDNPQSLYVLSYEEQMAVPTILEGEGLF